MSERKKPGELALVHSHEAGEILEIEPEKTELETLLETWEANTYRGEEILDMKPRRWLVPGWLPLDSLLAVYAGPGVGKSFYALSLALEMARGGSWVGTPLTASPVLYVAAERGTELRDRAEAWSKHYKRELPQSLEILDTPRPPQLTDGFDIEALCTKVKNSGAKLVILDTYARMTLGIEENSARETGPILEALDKIRRATDGGTVLVVHHTGKDPSRGLRGSTAFLGAVDMGITLANNGGNLKASVEKSNAGPAPIPEWYKLETVDLDIIHDNEPRTSAVLAHTGAPRKDENLEEIVLEALRTTTTGSLSKKEILEAVQEAGGAVNSMSSLDRLALRPLRDRGLIQVTGEARATRYSLIEEN